MGSLFFATAEGRLAAPPGAPLLGTEGAAGQTLSGLIPDPPVRSPSGRGGRRRRAARCMRLPPWLVPHELRALGASRHAACCSPSLVRTLAVSPLWPLFRLPAPSLRLRPRLRGRAGDAPGAVAEAQRVCPPGAGLVPEQAAARAQAVEGQRPPLDPRTPGHTSRRGSPRQTRSQRGPRQCAGQGRGGAFRR